MDNLTKSTTPNIPDLNYKNEFLKALHLNGEYDKERLQNNQSRKFLKKKAFDRAYTLRELFTAISKDDGDCSLLMSYLKEKDNSYVKAYEYINSSLRQNLCSLMDSNYKKKNNKKREIIGRNLHIFDNALYRPLQICKSFIKCFFNEGFEPKYFDNVWVSEQTNNYNDKIKSEIEEYVKRDINGEKFSLVDLLTLHIYAELTAFITGCSVNALEDVNKNYHEAVHCFAYYILDWYADLDVNGPATAEGIFYGKEAIQINNIMDQQRAFNDYGLCAVAKGYKQLAYDIYYSWIEKKPVGNLKGMKLPNFDIGNEELSKIINDSTQDKIYNNFAVVCSDIAASCINRYDGKKKHIFYTKSIESIDTAVKNERLPEFVYCTYGDILCENESWEDTNYFLAKEQYEKFEKSWNILEKIEALRSEMTVLLQVFMRDYEMNKDKDLCDVIADNEIYYDKFWGELRKYYETAEDYFVNAKGDDTYEKEQWEEWKQLLCTIQKIGDFIIDDNKVDDTAEKRFIFILLMIQETTMSIKEELKWKDYISDSFYTRCDSEDESTEKSDNSKIIAYYTTLRTATHVFEELVQDDIDKAPRLKKDEDPDDAGINCMTVMHAKYMNDPYEGLKLLDVLTKVIKKDGDHNALWEDNGKSFREDLFNHDFVFLKSFTDSMDNLVMWNRYASDTSNDGKDSNGCFVELDNESFRTVVVNNEKNINVLIKHNTAQDDYNLYRVVYISKDGEISDDKNPELSKKAKDYYNLLKKLITVLNQYLCDDDFKKRANTGGDIIVNLVMECLKISMKYIIFLFKEDDYADERESRIVFTRNADQQKLIRLIPGNPDKLCINPYFQIYISKIILGPNVRDDDEWIPYFQYHLNNMWLKHPDVRKDSQVQPQNKYTIKPSEKHYRSFGNNK